MQNAHILDARGCPCPQPLIKTRKLWKTLQPGERFRVLMDNEIAFINLMTFLEDQQARPESSRQGADWVIDAVRTGEASVAVSPAKELQTEVAKPVEEPSSRLADYLVVLKSDRMGDGDEALGKILIKGYLSTLCELDQKPRTIVLYNAGVHLAAHNSGSETALATLQQAGVDIMVCGACVDFYELQGQLAAGRISNMYDIAEQLAAAGHVVYP